jgi:hypothetical protein
VDKLPQHFDVEPGIHNLENGYWSITPRSVAQVYAEQTAFVTKTNSIWARNVLPGGACLAAGGREARESIARMVGASPDTGRQVTVATNNSGFYVVRSLATAHYDLKITAPGFQTFSETGLTLDTTHVASERFLKPGAYC